MAGPNIPVTASFPVPPPTAALPVVNPGDGRWTPAGLEFMQWIWAALQGGGGLIDLTLLELPSPGPVAAVSALANEAHDVALALLSRPPPAPPAPLKQPFGYVASVRDISTWAGATMRIAIGVGWTFQATTSFPAGAVYGEVANAPSAQTDFDLRKDGISVATARWAASSQTPTLIKSADTAFVASDYLDIVAPSNLNGMSGPWSLTVIGTRP